jgi:hypothetical protein
MTCAASVCVSRQKKVCLSHSPFLSQTKWALGLLSAGIAVMLVVIPVLIFVAVRSKCGKRPYLLLLPETTTPPAAELTEQAVSLVSGFGPLPDVIVSDTFGGGSSSGASGLVRRPSRLGPHRSRSSFFDPHLSQSSLLGSDGFAPRRSNASLRVSPETTGALRPSEALLPRPSQGSLTMNRSQGSLKVPAPSDAPRQD